MSAAATNTPEQVVDRRPVMKPRDGFTAPVIIKRRVEEATNHIGVHSYDWHPNDRERVCRELGRRFTADADYWKDRNERDGVPG